MSANLQRFLGFRSVVVGHRVASGVPQMFRSLRAHRRASRWVGAVKASHAFRGGRSRCAKPWWSRSNSAGRWWSGDGTATSRTEIPLQGIASRTAQAGLIVRPKRARAQRHPLAGLAEAIQPAPLSTRLEEARRRGGRSSCHCCAGITSAVRWLVVSESTGLELARGAHVSNSNTAYALGPRISRTASGLPLSGCHQTTNGS